MIEEPETPREVSLLELCRTLDRFASLNDHARSINLRWLAGRARQLSKIAGAIESTSKLPDDVKAEIAKLRISEVEDERRRLSVQIDALNSEERGLREKLTAAS